MLSTLLVERVRIFIPKRLTRQTIVQNRRFRKIEIPMKEIQS